MDQETRAQLKQILLSRKWTLRAQTTAGKREKPSGVDGLKEQGMSALSAGIDDCGMPVLHPLMHRLWQARDYHDSDILELLFPEEICYPDPFLFTDLRIAVEIIRSVLNGKGKILVFGDYDADGLTATALLLRWFRQREADVISMIPDRLRDGYGLTPDQVSQIIAHNPDLVITVDCGSSSLEEVGLLEANGIRVIVTDHHACTDDPHPASAFINPQREGEGFPLSGLAGVGVAYYLVLGLIYPAEPEPLLTVLAAIGTVADVMPLRGVNRRLVVDAIAAYSKHAPIGIRKLAECCRKAEENLSVELIQFNLAPRLNAAGRLGQAEVALELLLTDLATEAELLAARLNELNNERRELEKEQIEQIRVQVESELVPGHDRIIIAAYEALHPGILGILSARLADHFQLPAICLTLEEGIYRGSGRSYGNFDLYAAIESCQDLLLSFGGHTGAAGLSLAADKLEEFTTRIKAYIARAGDFVPAELIVDLELMPQDLTTEAVQSLELLEPTGEQNPKPLFLLSDARIAEIYRVGDGSHLRIVLEIDGAGRIAGVAFRKGMADLLYSPGDRVDIICYLTSNVWQGVEKVNLQIEELRLARQETKTAQPIRIERSQIASVYHGLSKLIEPEQELLFDPLHLAHWLSSTYNGSISEQKLIIILQLFAQSGLGSMRQTDHDNWAFSFRATTKRVDLRTTELWQQLEQQGSIANASRE
ncbi:MAG: single-stranded-DNA-specific exonuclease RecJ [Saccharofermentanales bacterium]|jgi:single-stranded-DNA-specific exonuclease|nr:single-stranded-DNA-specific exonuclease RecJ [Bacillota bacterium]